MGEVGIGRECFEDGRKSTKVASCCGVAKFPGCRMKFIQGEGRCQGGAFLWGEFVIDVGGRRGRCRGARSEGLLVVGLACLEGGKDRASIACHACPEGG